jgi:hypothetical protein
VWIVGRVFPFDEDITAMTVKLLLDELDNAGRIVRYEVDGDPFIYLPKLHKHQRLEPSKVESRLPEPPANPVTHSDAESSEPRADESAPDAETNVLLYVAGSMEHGAGSMEPACGAQTAPSDTKPARAHRLPEGWTPPPALIDQLRGVVPDEYAAAELAKFRDHWAAAGGQNARKVDWAAAWRNWVRNAVDRNPPRQAGRSERVAAGRTVAEQLRAQGE